MGPSVAHACRIVACLSLALFSTGAASAQAFNPYHRPPFPEERCLYNPYVMEWLCRELPAQTATGVRLGVAEGVIGAPTHELGWVVVINPEGQTQRVRIRFLLEDRPIPIEHLLEIPAMSRRSHSLHEDRLLWTGGIVTFGTVVECEFSCAAQLVTRSAADPWGTQTVLTLAPLPVVTVTSAPAGSR